jgi:hypothetical protein
VAVVKVGIGFSTLLQFDTRPSQAIVGDQDSFKIEYVGNAIAIKPLISGVSTNLFVVTDVGKFNFRISAMRGFEPDYVLRIKRKSDEPSRNPTALRTKITNTQVTKNGLTLHLNSVASAQSNSVLIYSFRVATKDRRLRFDAGDFEIVQISRSLSIESIYLDRVLLSPGNSLNGMILIRRSELKRGQQTWLRVTQGNDKQGLRILTPAI